jgi:SAM-dependent methyltransferase
MPKVIAERLRRGMDPDDDTFDRLYPDWGRRLSRVHWTPVTTARRAAQWLVSRPGVRVLDVGAGVGKFALVGSLVTDGVFYGIEQRQQFVEAAQAAARGVGAKRAHFLHGNMMTLKWEMFDAYYLYNPFLEELHADDLTRSQLMQADVLRTYVDFVQRQLARAPVGTRVATFHGFGGEMPPFYELQPQHGMAVEHLELWIRRAGPRA